MALITDWKDVLKKAWSVKFMLMAALLSGCEVAVQFIEPTIAEMMPKGMFASLAGFVTAGALVARVLAQNEGSDDAKK